jgi:hypothetical protein
MIVYEPLALQGGVTPRKPIYPGQLAWISANAKAYEEETGNGFSSFWAPVEIVTIKNVENFNRGGPRLRLEVRLVASDAVFWVDATLVYEKMGE